MNAPWVLGRRGVALVDYDWPDDINDWDAWPEQTGLDWIDGLLAHLDGFTIESFREALIEDVLSSDDAVIIAERAAERCPDFVGKIRWLQEPLYNTNLWPEYWADGFQKDYLDLMWKITELIGTHLQDLESASAVLNELMQDDDIWHCAVGPAAILAQHPVNPDSVNTILLFAHSSLTGRSTQTGCPVKLAAESNAISLQLSRRRPSLRSPALILLRMSNSPNGSLRSAVRLLIAARDLPTSSGSTSPGAWSKTAKDTTKISRGCGGVQ